MRHHRRVTQPLPDTQDSTDVMAEEAWRAAKAEHERIVDGWAAPRLARRQRGERHPVDDFLWEYYPVRPAQLRRWSPGLGVYLAGNASVFAEQRGFVDTPDGVRVEPSALGHQLVAAAHIRELLVATASRTPRFGCFALHEWAMVYGLTQDEVRHNAWPLRLDPEDVRTVVADLGLRCTHFDAFRFYTEAAQPLNPIRLTRATQVDYEQPGCLHANMDLFKWAWQLFPLASSELVRATRLLATEVRHLDMRAAPYDLRQLGVEPLAIETADGRAEFAVAQKEFTTRAELLRAQLIAVTDGVPL